jgi:hypothetical protein
MHKGDKEGLDMEWDAVKAVMGGNRNTKCCFDDKEKYKWAVMCINSRALTLQGVKYLIPIADMVNYQVRENIPYPKACGLSPAFGQLAVLPNPPSSRRSLY